MLSPPSQAHTAEAPWIAPFDTDLEELRFAGGRGGVGCSWKMMSLIAYCLLVAAEEQQGSRR